MMDSFYLEMPSPYSLDNMLRYGWIWGFWLLFLVFTGWLLYGFFQWSISYSLIEPLDETYALCAPLISTL